MAVTDRQVRLLMNTYEKTGIQEMSAAKAGMCRQTAGKYLAAGKMPSGMKCEHNWRTREDPFADHWAEAEFMLKDAPELEAKSLFEWLHRKYPNDFDAGQLRTFQRRVRNWRALSGPENEVFFPQVHHPGRRMALDFTSMNELNITIAGEPFPHLLCHSVLTYSNWEWATVCFSESFSALRDGVQNTLFRLGHVPAELWTDNSSSATHNPGAKDEEGRKFNQRYLDMAKHFGIRACKINVRKPHENGDVESSNGILKRRVKQHLLLRGSRNFTNRDAYSRFTRHVMDSANSLRRKRLTEELETMPILNSSRLSDWDEEQATVRKWSTVRVAHNAYSVPSRLIGKDVTARVYEDRIEVYFRDVLQLSAPRLRGRGNSRIDYRHVIRSLVRKPGAFRDYRYREEMFPTLNFRRAYDALCDKCTPRVADREYLRILKMAADTMQTDVDAVLSELLEKNAVPRWHIVEDLMPEPSAIIPELKEQNPCLAEYDKKLTMGRQT